MCDVGRAEMEPWSAVAADRLGHLVEMIHPHPHHREPLSNAEIADGVNEKGAAQITIAQVATLRAGTTAQADPQQVTALAAFFGIPRGYFQDDVLAVQVDEELDEVRALAELRSRGVTTIRACSRNGERPNMKTLLAIDDACRAAVAQL